MTKKKSKPEPRKLVLFEHQKNVIEMFHDPGWTLRNYTRNEPSFVNNLTMRKFRVTIELIDEPVEVLRERLIRLWRESENNGHYYNDAKQAAEELGIDWNWLRPQQAVDHKKKREHGDL